MVDRRPTRSNSSVFDFVPWRDNAPMLRRVTSNTGQISDQRFIP